MFVIESDATIVVPLLLSALLECKHYPDQAQVLIAASRNSFDF
jgi:deoxyhypusine synthase